MLTEKLFERDSYLREFDAKVLRLERDGALSRLVLDRTAFFPEGGGQGSDTGTLGNASVLDVQIKDDEIYHITDSC